MKYQYHTAEQNNAMQKYTATSLHNEKMKATSTVHLSQRESLRSSSSSSSSCFEEEEVSILPPSRNRLVIPVSEELALDVDFSESSDDDDEEAEEEEDRRKSLPEPISLSSSPSLREKCRSLWLSDIINVEEPGKFCLDEQVSHNFAELFLTSKHSLRTKKEIATDEFSPHNQNARNELIAESHCYILLSHFLTAMLTAYDDDDHSTNLSGATPEEILTGDFCGFVPSCE